MTSSATQAQAFAWPGALGAVLRHGWREAESAREEAAWVLAVLGAEPGCFGGPNGVDQATGQSESGHGCASVAAKSFGADRLGEVYNFPCYRVDHSRHDGRGRPMNVVAPERSWRMTPHCVRLAAPGKYDENSSMLLAAVVALREP